MSKIVSFRGLLASGEQETISLHTNTGMDGYMIRKFEIIGRLPGTETCELTGKIYTIPQTTVDSTIDFSDQTLIGTAYLEQNSSTNSMEPMVVIFDNVTFNQDIYVTAFDDTTAAPNGKPMNYHIELEQVKLDLNENTVATLKDIRNITG